MRANSALAALTAIAASACTQPAPTDGAALREAAEAYHAAAISKDRAAVLAFYADDAMMVPPGAERIQGIAEVRNYRFGFIENPSVETRFETVSVDISSGGDVGWTLAIVEVSFEGPDGEPSGDRIRDFHQWRLDPDGSWKIVVDMWNSERP